MKRKIAWYTFLFCVLAVLFYAVKFLLKKKHPTALKFLDQQSKKYRTKIDKINKQLKKLNGSKKNAKDYKDTSIVDDYVAVKRNLRKIRDKHISSKKRNG